MRIRRPHSRSRSRLFRRCWQQVTPPGQLILGTIDIVNSCACGGDVAIIDYAFIVNHGRTEIDAPTTVLAVAWQNRDTGVIVTSGTGVIGVTSSILGMSNWGTIVGSTVLQLERFFWYEGTIGTTASGSSVIKVKGGTVMLEEMSPLQGCIDADTEGGALEVLGRVAPDAHLHITALWQDSLRLAGLFGPSMINEGTLTIETKGRTVAAYDTVINRGTLEITGGFFVTRDTLELRGQRFVNEGTIDMRRTDLRFTAPGAVFLNSSYFPSRSLDLSRITMAAGTGLAVLPGSDINVWVYLDHATLSGVGEVGRVRATAATIVPGLPYGTLDVFDVELDDSSKSSSGSAAPVPARTVSSLSSTVPSYSRARFVSRDSRRWACRSCWRWSIASRTTGRRSRPVPRSPSIRRAAPTCSSRKYSARAAPRTRRWS